MSLRDKFAAQKTKLDNLCEEHHLTSTLKLSGPVVTLTLRPLQGAYEQLSMLEQADMGKPSISPDAYLQFWEDDGEFGTDGGFYMGDPLQNKFKNIFKKLDMYYCQFFRKTAIEAQCLKPGMVPFIEEDSGADPEQEQPAETSEIDAEDLDVPNDEPEA